MQMMERKQWWEGERFFRQEELIFRDCDVLGRVRPAALVVMMGSIGGYDYDARGLTYETLYALRQVFLISRMSFRLHSYPTAGEVITLSSWENGVRGAHMQRNYEFFRRDGSLFLSGKSDWILVDPVDRKILRPSAFTAKPLGPALADVDCPDCRKILPPREKLTEAAVRKVRFTDLDHNGHLYSGRYPDIVWDELPEDLQRGTLRDFQINYSKEATLGEKLTLLACREGQTYEMEGLCGPERCFTCRCEFV
ncbi:acyl-[acyl-carrier-protein] thioesterase [Dysosmobacter sp.]|uniref:acyl-[acyl-carrier-protein] thioesterase n=1 Tax=Dysosmobacter sp. TaxID=2591382 RepID=UPI002A8B9323|nr:acyl-ACP thioesterase domain-containing protein [Dysosmobacter sp.]MDY3281864.1 thioesterase [Dysosmobacter sp.]